MIGNFDVDVAHQQRVGHLFGPLPPEMRNDTAFMDRIHAYLPGWDAPKVDPSLFTDHFGLVSDFLSEAWTRLRDESRLQGFCQNSGPQCAADRARRAVSLRGAYVVDQLSPAGHEETPSFGR